MRLFIGLKMKGTRKMGNSRTFKRNVSRYPLNIWRAKQKAETQQKEIEEVKEKIQILSNENQSKQEEIAN